jgi:hypothetical protein
VNLVEGSPGEFLGDEIVPMLKRDELQRGRLKLQASPGGAARGGTGKITSMGVMPFRCSYILLHRKIPAGDRK